MTILADSADAGLCLVEDRGNRAVYMFNHLEYDAGTLRDEFLRDRSAGRPADIPVNYFPEDDPTRAPENLWRPFAHLLFRNWLGEVQRTASAREIGKPLLDQSWRRRMQGKAFAAASIAALAQFDELPIGLAEAAVAGVVKRLV